MPALLLSLTLDQEMPALLMLNGARISTSKFTSLMLARARFSEQFHASKYFHSSISQ
jgi:hypothetical protein